MFSKLNKENEYSPDHSCDVLIIGSGAARLSLALRLADQHQVIVLSKGPVTEGSTFYAQGGIAAVFDETDSIDSHVEDTLIAGVVFAIAMQLNLSPAMHDPVCNG